MYAHVQTAYCQCAQLMYSQSNKMLRLQIFDNVSYLYSNRFIASSCVGVTAHNLDDGQPIVGISHLSCDYFACALILIDSATQSNPRKTHTP